MLSELLLLPLIVGLVRGGNRLAPDVTDQLDRGDAGVRCPCCGWRPAKHDSWACNPGCGRAWNTFETGGECPDCGKRWGMTQCLHCGTWSRHEDWYEDVAAR